MAWAFVQKKDSSTGVAQFSSNTTTGHQVIVVNNAGTGFTSVAISPGGGTFSKVKSASSSGGFITEIWLCPNITGGTTPTVTGTGGSGSGITIYEFSGGNTSGTTDGTNATNNGSSGSMTTGQITTGTSGDLVVKGFACQGTPNGTAESGWSEVNPTLNGNIAGYIIQSSAGAITGTDTQTGGTNYCGCIIALLAAGATATTVFPTAIATLLTSCNMAGGDYATWEDPNQSWDSN
jgi:hypothetical protein